MKTLQLCSLALALSCSPLLGQNTVNNLPDPLIAANGQRITTAKQWQESRRGELLELFATQMYGKAPAPLTTQRFEVTAEDKTALDGKATRKDVTIYFSAAETPSMRLTLFTPNGTGKPSPMFMSFSGFGNPIDTLIAHGYGFASFRNAEVAADGNQAFVGGVYPLFYKDGQTKPADDEWGVLAAWGWGLSRAMDYLETDKDVDAKKVAIIGTSRLGKAVLWAGATDERFALTIPNVSGMGGAALMRSKKAETVADLNKNFPYWIAGNFKKYSNAEETLPFDQHELIALCAPRLVYVSDAAQDQWVDTEGEWLSAVNANPVYALFGLTGVAATERPAIDTPVLTGQIGFHTRSGGHGITPYDWQQYFRFLDIHWK